MQRRGKELTEKGYGDTFWSAKINLLFGVGERAQMARWGN